MDEDETGGTFPPAPTAGLELEPGTNHVVRGGGRARWAVAFVAVVAAIVGLVVLVAGSSGDDADADAALAAAQELVAGSDSYRFEVLRADRIVIGDPQGAGSDTTTRSLTRGEVAAPDRWHVVEESGGSYFVEPETERTRIAEEVFTRWGSGMPDPDGVDLPAWTALPAGPSPTAEDLAFEYGAMGDEVCYDDDDEEVPCDVDAEFEAQQKVDLAVQSYLLPVSMDPHHVKRLVAEATDPVVEERLSDGGLRLRTRLAPIPEIAAAADEPLPPVDLLLDLDAGRRPSLARFTAALDSVSSAVEVRYRDWGAPIEVAPPPEGDVDRTPWIDEQLLALTPELLVAPSQPPPGFVLTGAYGSPAFADEACPSVHLEYRTEQELAMFGHDDFDPEVFDELYEEIDHLTIGVAQADCDDDMAFGSYYSPGMEVTSREVRFGPALVTIDTTLDDAAVDALVASLRAFTVDELAASIPEGAGGGWFAYAPGSYGWG